jgi:C4-dicarboxylate-specific signal transduction histidine kinase
LLDGIRVGAGRTARIVKRLVSYASPMEEETDEADIAFLLDSTLALLETRYPGDIRIELRYAARPYIRCFPVKLTQLFQCVLENAFDAAKTSDSPAVRIELDARTEDDVSTVMVTVSDSGPGVPACHTAQDFRSFLHDKGYRPGGGIGTVDS